MRDTYTERPDIIVDIQLFSYSPAPYFLGDNKMRNRGYPLPRAHGVNYGYVTDHFDRNCQKLEIITGSQGRLKGVIKVWDIVSSVFFIDLEDWELEAVIDGFGPRYISHQLSKDYREFEKTVANFKKIVYEVPSNANRN